jgi:hypothetical protein
MNAGSNFVTGRTDNYSIEEVKRVPKNVVRERHDSKGVGLAAINQSLNKYSLKNTSPPKYQVQPEDDQNPSVFTVLPPHKPCDVVTAGNLNDRFNRLKEQRVFIN